MNLDYFYNDEGDLSHYEKELPTLDQFSEEEVSSFEESVEITDNFSPIVDISKDKKKPATNGLLLEEKVEDFKKYIRELVLLREEIADNMDLDYLFYEASEEELAEFLRSHYKNFRLEDSEKGKRHRISSARVSMMLDAVRDEEKKKEFQEKLKKIRDNLFACFSPYAISNYINKSYFGEARKDPIELSADLFLALSTDALDKISRLSGAEKYCMDWLRSRVSKGHARDQKDLREQQKSGGVVSLDNEAFDSGKRVEEFTGVEDANLESLEKAETYKNTFQSLLAFSYEVADEYKLSIDILEELTELLAEMENLIEKKKYSEACSLFSLDAAEYLFSLFKDHLGEKKIKREFKNILNV